MAPMEPTQARTIHDGRPSWRPATPQPVYGMGMIGALVYFLQHATTFSSGAQGVLKALFWPGFLVYELLRFLRL